MGKKLKIVLTSLNRSKKSAHCLRCVGHAPSDCPNVEETRNQMQPIRLEEIHTFFQNKS